MSEHDGSQAEVQTERCGAVVVARVIGEVDVFNASTVGAAIEAALEPDAHALVIDLSGLGFMDSTAIRQLFSLHALVTGRRQQLRVVVTAGGPVERTLGLVDFAQAAPVVGSMDAALDGLEAG